MRRTVVGLGAAVALATLSGLAVLAIRPPAHEGRPESPPGEAVERLLVVYHDPACGCCTAWIRYMEAAGYRVRAVATNEMERVREEAGVPAKLRACHTAFLGAYVIEGHVPAEAVERLATGVPADVRGVAVPGMPLGSPGMPGELGGPLQILAFGAAGVTQFMSVAP